MRVTEQQKQAIEVLNQGGVLLEAGAGSGKTFVLVRRYVRSLRTALKNPNVGMWDYPVLAMTFTEKAASELRGRIRSFLRNLLEKEKISSKEKEYFALHVAEDDWLGVSTIHGFCRRLIWSYLPLLGHGFDCRIQDAEETEFLKDEVFDRFITEDRLQKKDLLKEKRFLLETTTVQRLRRACFQLVEQLDPKKLREFSEVSFEDAHQYLRKRQSQYLAEELGADHQEWLTICEEAIRSIDPAKKLHLYVTAVKGLLEKTRHLVVEKAGNDSAAALEFSFQTWVDEVKSIPRFPAPRKEGVEKELAYQVKKVGDHLKEVAKILGDSQKFEKEALKQILTFFRFSYRYDESCESQKKRLDVLDFDDLEHRALTVLEEVKRRENLTQQFQEILVDEFQDTSRRQFQILERLCHKDFSNLYAIGDAKQSIYGFRGADVTVINEFRERANSILPLSKNFRSHSKILDLVNGVSSQIFPKAIDRSELKYEAPFQYLEAGASATSTEEPVEWFEFQVQDDWGAFERKRAECRHIAKRIDDLIQNGTAPKDICILLRQLSGYEGLYKELEQLDIPFKASRAHPLAKNPEVLFLLGLFRWIFQPDDPSNALLLRQGSFGSEGVEPSWKQFLIKHPVFFKSKEGWALFEEWFFDLLKSKGQRLSLDALKFLDHVKEACGENGYGLTEFIEILDRLRAEDQWKMQGFYAEEDGSEGETGNVRVMTIHSSKGLEFPVVLLAGLTQRLKQPPRSGLLINPDDGIPGLSAWDSVGVQNQKTFDYRKNKEILRKRENAELKRLFYVALTRPKNKLIILLPSSKGNDWSQWLQQYKDS